MSLQGATRSLLRDDGLLPAQHVSHDKLLWYGRARSTASHNRTNVRFANRRRRLRLESRPRGDLRRRHPPLLRHQEGSAPDQSKRLA